MKKPNILIITSDQQRKDSMGVYNCKTPTPAMDSVAKDGVVFDRAYITHPTCTPSRATILTGQYGSRHGAYSIGTCLPKTAPTMSQCLTDDGYDTYFIGKAHFQQLSTKGSEEYFEHGWDESYWKDNTDPYYGFTNVKMYNGHTTYPLTAGFHYRIWLKEKGLTDEDINRIFNHVSTDRYRQHGKWEIEKQYHTSVFTSECAIDYLNNRDDEKPFMMWASFSDPHDPHMTPEPYASMYSPEDVNYLGYKEGELDDKPHWYKALYEYGDKGLGFVGNKFGVPSAPSAKLSGDDDYYKKITALHNGMVRFVDDEIGKIIDTLKAKGLYDNTVIIYSTDHGDYLGNHGFLYKGFPSYEDVYNVPFIVKNQNNKNANTRTDNLMSHVDIATTVLSLAGVTIPEDMQGIDQTNAWLDSNNSVRKEVIIENRPIQRDFYQKMIVTSQYKLVAYMDSTEGELYDLTIDKDQYTNLWFNAEFATVKNELLNKLTNNNGLSDTACLRSLSDSMHAEEPVQARTSFS